MDVFKESGERKTELGVKRQITLHVRWKIVLPGNQGRIQKFLDRELTWMES